MVEKIDTASRGEERTSDCPGPRKETTDGLYVTQGDGVRRDRSTSIGAIWGARVIKTARPTHWSVSASPAWARDYTGGSHSS